MTAFTKYLFAALAILAMGSSQVMGITRGYVCHCAGEPVMVDAPDCASAGCHEHDHDGGTHDEKDGDHHHEGLKNSLVSLSFAPLVVAMPVLVETNVLVEFFRSVRLHVELAEQHEAMILPDSSGCGPPASVLVARTMVMLV